MLSRAIRSVVMIVAACVLFAGTSVAEPQGPDYARNGGYLGAGLALGWENYDGFGGLPGSFDTGVGFDAWGGYRFHPNFAGELELEYVDRVNNGALALDTNLLTFTGNLKAYLATGRVQPFALVGIGATRVGLAAGGGSASESAFGARFGGGLDFYVTEQIALQARASYVLATGDLDGFDYISLVMGAQFRF